MGVCNASSTEEVSVQTAITTLHKAAKDKSVPPVEVFKAMREVEKAKVPVEDSWATLLGGTSSPGNRWRLVFTSGTKEVQQALKGLGPGGGKYFPITAAQRWDASKNEIENGIYLGHLAALTFKGPYKMSGKKLQFDFDTLTLKLGPSFSLPLKARINPEMYAPDPKGPFFLFAYIDDKICIARGRGGGIAMWARTSPEWELKNGLV